MTRSTVLLSILLAALAGSAMAAKERTKEGAAQQASPSSTSVETRDWSKIDTDKDGYVEPAEMERYLQAVWSQNGKNTAAEEKPKKSN